MSTPTMIAEPDTASLSERERAEIEAANASDNTPVVFIHGLWLLPSSWANWADFFTQAGYAPLTPDWPDDPATVEQARANPDVLAKKTLQQVADHTTEIIEGGEEALRHIPRRRLRDLSHADGQREPQPADGGEGEHEEPRPRPPADHRRPEGPHGAV